MGFLEALQAAQADPDAWELQVKSPSGRLGRLPMPPRGVSLSDYLVTQDCTAGGRWRVSIFSARPGRDGSAARADLKEAHGQVYGRVLIAGEGGDGDPLDDEQLIEDPRELDGGLGSDLQGSGGNPAPSRTMSEAREFKAQKLKLQQEIEVRRLEKELRLLEGPETAPIPPSSGTDPVFNVLLAELRALKQGPSWTEALPQLAGPALQFLQAFLDGQAERSKALLAVATGRPDQAPGALDAGWDKLLPLLKELVGFLNELKGAGGGEPKSDLQTALEYGLPLLSGIRNRMNSTPSPKPAAVTPTPALPGGDGKAQDEMGRRVAAFVGQVTREAAADTDPEVAAENLEKLWGMLPREARTSIISSAPESLSSNLGRWLSEGQQGKLHQVLSTNAVASQWVGEFLNLLREGEEEYLKHQRGMSDGQNVENDPGAGTGGESPGGPGEGGPGSGRDGPGPPGSGG